MDRQDLARLSQLQRACLRLVHAGLSSKEIGRELGLSPHTIDNEVISARRVLGAKTRTEAAAVLFAAENRPDGQSDGQPPAIEPEPSADLAGGRPSTGRRWPFPTAGRPANDLTAFQKIVWMVVIAFAAILVVGFLVDSIERLGRMV